MVSPFRRPRLTLAVAPTTGAVAGLAIAVVAVAIPQTLLETWVGASGLPDIVAAAAPPLQVTSRLVLSVIGGGVVGMIVWRLAALVAGAATVTIGGPRRSAADASNDQPVPVIRRADAHPDAPPRAPLNAHRDLGTPFLDIRAPMVAGPIDGPDAVRSVDALDAEMARDVPADLDLPLSAFDPAAFAAATGAPVPISRFAAGERIETFELTPIIRTPSPTPAAPPPARTSPRDTEATITALLERLERGVTQRAERGPVVGSGPDTGSFRRLASGR